MAGRPPTTAPRPASRLNSPARLLCTYLHHRFPIAQARNRPCASLPGSIYLSISLYELIQLPLCSVPSPFARIVLLAVMVYRPAYLPTYLPSLCKHTRLEIQSTYLPTYLYRAIRYTLCARYTIEFTHGSILPM